MVLRHPHDIAYKGAIVPLLNSIHSGGEPTGLLLTGDIDNGAHSEVRKGNGSWRIVMLMKCRFWLFLAGLLNE